MLRSEVNGANVMASSSNNDSELLLLNQLLQDVALSQFASKIIEELQVNKVKVNFTFKQSFVCFDTHRFLESLILIMLLQKT